MFGKTTIVSTVIAIFMSGAFVLPTAAAELANVQIDLDNQTASISYIASQIRSQARSQGVRLTDSEVQSAAQSAANNLSAADPGPQKGIIHIKFKKITVCISWGADKGHC